MTITKTITLYSYDELPTEAAKEKARDWWKEDVDVSYEFVYTDAATVASLMGIEIDQREYKTVGGSTRTKPKIWWRGFWSQGDGACFEGTYRYRKGSVKAVKDHAPQDKELHRIAEGLMRVQKNHYYRLRAKVKQSGFYSHSGCTDIEVYDENDPYKNIGAAEGEITKLLRDFMDCIYGQLKAEYEYQTSDEVVAELLSNDPHYTFTASGKRED